MALEQRYENLEHSVEDYRLAIENDHPGDVIRSSRQVMYDVLALLPSIIAHRIRGGFRD